MTTNTMGSYAVADLEADGLLYEATQIWCLCWVDHLGVSYKYDKDNILEGLGILNQYDKVIFHNGFGYDYPLLKKIYNWTFTTHCEDTFVLSSLFFPDIGGHSINAWGERFGIKKPEHDDWSTFSVEMLHRCVEDARIGMQVWLKMLQPLSESSWESSVRLEYAMASIASTQEQNGVKVDIPLMKSLLERIDDERSIISAALHEEIPPNVVHTWAVVARPFTKQGFVSKIVYKWFGGTPNSSCGAVCGSFSKVEFNPINLRSAKQVKDYLLSKGWQPTQWNYKKDATGREERDDNGKPIRTSPKITEDSFHSVRGSAPEKLCRLSILNHRRSMLTNEAGTTGWLNLYRTDGRIAAAGVPQGTPTGRYRHRVVVNVPKAREDIPFGVEFRSIFCVEDGYVMLGSDAAALEARIEAHYTYPYDGGEYARELMEGDVHAANALIFGVNRDLAKNGKYALTYGAQAGKLAETLGKNSREAARLFKEFWVSNSALGRLREDVIKAYQHKGFVYGLDGRKLFCRSEHGALNYLFQSAGSIVVKTATCYMDKRLHSRGFDFKQVLHMHDEVAYEIKEEDVEEITEIVKASWIDAGTYWNLNIPIEGDVQIGKNWADVH